LPDIVAEVAAFERHGTLDPRAICASSRATMRSGACVPRARRALLAVLENIRKTLRPDGRKTNCAIWTPGTMSNFQVL